MQGPSSLTHGCPGLLLICNKVTETKIVLFDCAFSEKSVIGRAVCVHLKWEYFPIQIHPVILPRESSWTPVLQDGAELWHWFVGM